MVVNNKLVSELNVYLYRLFVWFNQTMSQSEIQIGLVGVMDGVGVLLDVWVFVTVTDGV